MNDFQVVLDQDPRASLTELECAPAFMDGSAYVFQHPQILRIWLNTIGAARSTKPYFIRIIGPEADPIAVLPLGIETSGTCRILRFLDGGVSDYNAPIPIGKFDVFERLDAAQLWSKIIEVLPRFDLALLHKIPRMVGSLPNFLARLKVEPHHSNGHIATLSGNWDNYFSNRPKSSRTQKNRRLRERLAQCGSLRFSVADTLEQRKAYFEATARQKRRKLIETRGFDSFGIGKTAEFYQSVNETIPNSKMLHVSALLLDDRILASHWGYILGRRFYYLLPGYEAGEWARYGPGNILNECLLQWCFSNGIETFDFGIGDETYKSYWCDQDINLFDFNCALTLKGKAYLALLQSREALRRSGRVRQAVRQLRKWGRSPATPTDGGVS